MPEKTSPTLEAHKKKFSKCLRCPLGLNTLLHCKNNRVYFTGPSKCDLLVIGEAPGVAELATGDPLSNQAGDLLRSYIEDVFSKDYKVIYKDLPTRSPRSKKPLLSVGFTNSVICPATITPNGKFRTPKKSETSSCSPRLLDLINLTSARFLITAGRVAERALKSAYPKDSTPNYYYICHPSAIIRQEEAGVIDIKRTKHTLSLILQEL